MDQLRKENADGVQLKCFVWIQGESDATPDYAPLYRRNLAALIERLRQSYGSAFRIVLGVSERHPGILQFPAIKDAQSRLAKEMPGVRTVSTADLETVDGTHFTPESQLALGNRIFQSCFGMF